MTFVAVVVLGLLMPFVIFDLVARPTIRRLAIRNVVRRPGEAALVVGGSLLATALITASFIIGDSFGSSIRGLAVDRWGPTDELILIPDLDQVPEAVEQVRSLSPELIDGALGVSWLDVAVASTGSDRRVEPEVTLLELDPREAIEYTADPAVVGADSAGSLRPDEIVINQRIADELGVEAGEEVDVFIGGSPVSFQVAAVRPATGLNGLAQAIVTPGAVTDHFDDPSSVVTPAVLISNTGDVFSGADRSAEAVAAIEAKLGDNSQVIPVKQDLLDDAKAEGAEMRELFGTVGGFSVAAGILLMINLFVMLAGERTSEMGVLRATGLRRGHLVRAFSMEGAAYGVMASALGIGVGIGVAAVVMRMASGLFEGEFTIRLDIVATSLLSGAVIGLMVSQLTVLLTTWRVTRLNIVRAIRELPEPRGAGGSRRRLAFGLVGVIAGVGLYLATGTTPTVAIFAPVVALISSVPLLERLIARKVAVIATSGLALAWVATVFGLLPDVMADPDISLFLIQGVLLVGLATIIVANLDKVWLGLAQVVSRGGIAVRMGMAEPLARPVRSALLVAMYSLVIFTVTFMAVMNAVFQAQAPDFAVQAGGGYDLYLDANASSGLTATDLTARGDVDTVAPVLRGHILGRSDEADDTLAGWRTSGIDETFLTVDPPVLDGRIEHFATDAEAWAEVAAGGPYVIVDSDVGLEPGDSYQFQGEGGSFTTFTIAGTTEQGWLVGAGAVMGQARVAELMADGRLPTRFYLTVPSSADPDVVAAQLTDSGAERGIDARTFLAAAKAETDAQQGFLYLLQAYLGLGLLIGIAGLGVVLARAVRERRRQFGVMRALGIAAPVIRRAFVVEASFVAVQGVVLGIGLGLLSSWQVLTRSSAFEDGLGFTVPAQILIGLALACLAASLLMTSVPAIRAGRTTPAVALRMTT
ncbi:MAG: FtsX-like permease family protein [Actinomycetia bacterium]|nr:FtsX-like permease family protein [Actinomycetes bacterium]